MSGIPFFLADGVSSCSTHNGIHRLMLFQLSKEGKPGDTVEIAIPEQALKDFVDVLSAAVIRK